MSLPKDILRNIISEYIEYDELKILESHVPGLYLNPKRRLYKFIKTDSRFYSRRLIIDGSVRIEEHYLENVIQKILSEDCYQVNLPKNIICCSILIVIIVLYIYKLKMF